MAQNAKKKLANNENKAVNQIYQQNRTKNNKQINEKKINDPSISRHINNYKRSSHDKKKV